MFYLKFCRNRSVAAFLLAVSIILMGNHSLLASARFVADPQEYELGELPEGKVLTYSLLLRNSGDRQLKLNLSGVSCGCLKILSPKGPFFIDPGQEEKLSFSFDTTGFSGRQVKFFFIDTNDPEQRVVRIKVEADIVERPDDFLARFNSFSAGAIIMAGLIDGLNPCAFTVLVFFVSFLSFVGYKRREMLLVGTVFILVCYFTYLLIGVGLFGLFRQSEAYHSLAKSLYILTGLAALILGCVSLYDAYIYRRTADPDRIRLKLPGMVKRRIQGVIRSSTDIRARAAGKKGILGLVISSAVCSFLVTLLESVCTGQMYFPTIAYIWRIPELRARSLAYLGLYNFMFVLPLVVIFVCGTFGVTSADFSRLAARNILRIKVLAALVFFMLGGALLLMR